MYKRQGGEEVVRRLSVDLPLDDHLFLKEFAFRAEVTQAAMVVTAGPLRGTSLSLGSTPILIGRAPECTLVLDDDFASGRHARLFPQDGGWAVEDLGSTNGTFLGGVRVGEPTRVDLGVPVRVGRTVLELRR